MPQIKVNDEQFENIIILYLLDKVTESSYNSSNQNFNDLMKKMNRGGIKTYLYSCFLEMDGNSKVKYNQIKSILNGGKGQASIIVAEDFVKEIVSKVIGKENPNTKKLKQLLESLEGE